MYVFYVYVVITVNAVLRTAQNVHRTTEFSMAVPLAFKPAPIDVHQELMHRVEAAPREHAEALLGAWDLLQAAHDQGLLEILHGLMGGRDIIAEKLAVAAKSEEAVALVRNAMALSRIVAAFNPDVLQRMAQSIEGAPGSPLEPQHQATEPPSLWQLFGKLREPDTRRGIGFALEMLNAFGRSTKP